MIIKNSSDCILAGLLTLLLAGCFQYINSSPEIIYIEKDDKGHIIEKRIMGNECCEGDYVRTYLYDSDGRDTMIYGRVDDHREKHISRYIGTVKTYTAYAQTKSDTSIDNFDINDSIVTYKMIKFYDLEGRPLKEESLSLYRQFEDYDTNYVYTKVFDNLGTVVGGSEYKKIKEFVGQDSFRQYCISEDFKNGTLDTVRIETKLSMGAY